MQKPLDPLGFKQNRYERPNQDWICGRASEGRPCPLGPDKHGNCRATGQCIPARKGDRWICTRSEADGGKCAEGPLPRGECSHPIPRCQPVRSLRRVRGIVVWMTLALTVGALLLLLGTTFRRAWINPGELTNAHATSAAKCSDCHSVDNASHPSVAGIGSPGKRTLADSALCLKCHSLGDQPLNSHGAGSVALTALDQKLQKAAGSVENSPLLKLSRAINGVDPHSTQIACLTCHQEHHGRAFNLKLLSNAQCQTCHSVQFASLEKGHPDFSDYPYQRRTRIYFDHNSHLQDHFAKNKDKAPDSCQACHITDPSGRFMQVNNFNVTCAACHGAQIQGEGMTVKGVAFFTVPGIDLETLSAKGISVGEWPKFADGKITPFMETLLNRDPVTRTALQELRDVNLLDLGKAAPSQIAAAEKLAWGVKNLLFNLIVEGQGYLLDQMKSQMPSAGQLIPAGLSGEISRSVLLAAQKEWMPNLPTEIANYRKGIKPPPAENPKPTPTLTAVPAPPKPAGETESLLGGEDLASTPSPTPTLTPAKEEDLAAGQLLEPSPEKSPPAEAVKQAAESAPTPVQSKPVEEWTAAGGWYHPQDSFTISYRPSGHADPFLAAWLTATAEMSAGSALARDAFQELADPQAPGLCMKCHTADRTSTAVTVNWLPARLEPTAHSFTVFKHTAHFSLMGDKGCQTCHVLSPKSEYAKYFKSASRTDSSVGDIDNGEANRYSHRFESNFKPLTKAQCVQCHKPKVAGDDCLLCHRYHTGTFATKLVGGGKIESASAKTSITTDKRP